MRSGARVSKVAPLEETIGSTRRQRRSGPSGARALQCASGSAARASENVGSVRVVSPQAAAHKGDAGVEFDARAQQQN